jgi:hypothetical protein
LLEAAPPVDCRTALGASLVAPVALAMGAGLAWNHPVAPCVTVVAFLLWCAVVAWRPGVWLFAVPAALPLLNFGPWTGWVAFEEFDLLTLGVVAGAYTRLALVAPAERGGQAMLPRGRSAFLGLAALFGAASTVALVRGLSAAGDIHVGWFQGYADPLNSWRVFKSVLYAALVWPLLRREIGNQPALAARRLALGMLSGLTVVTLAVLWERTAYAGLWDFSRPYRTTALFWEMHVGGAAIDAYLAMATPFVAWALWTARTPLRWSAAAALALLTGYACLTTFSRGVYIAVVGPLLLLGLLLARQEVDAHLGRSVLGVLWIGLLVLSAAAGLAVAIDAWGVAGAVLVLLGLALALLALKRRLSHARWRPMAALALAFLLALEVVVVLGWGSFMRERIAESEHDMGSRLTHWQHGLGLMQGPADAILGIGLGRLPAAYARHVPGGEFPGEVQLVDPGPGGGSSSVRLLGPKTRSDINGLLSLTQRVALRPVRPHQAGFDIRTGTQADVYLQLCEMHLLYPRHCQEAIVHLQPGGPEWRRATARLRGPLLDGGRAWAPRLGVFSIAVVNAGGAVEIGNVSLVGPDHTELLLNGGFAEGMAHWFPAAQGYYLPWHIDSLYLELLIERGLPALLAFVLFMGLALWRLVGPAGGAVPIAPFLAASLCGALCVGLVSSVMDVPRVAFLLFLLTIFAVEITARDAASRTRGVPSSEAVGQG